MFIGRLPLKVVLEAVYTGCFDIHENVLDLTLSKNVYIYGYEH